MKVPTPLLKKKTFLNVRRLIVVILKQSNVDVSCETTLDLLHSCLKQTGKLATYIKHALCMVNL